MKFLIVVLTAFVLTSCANVSTTTFEFKDPSGASLRVEMPKELDAQDLVVEINSKKGTATIRAKKISTSNVGTIQAQAGREKSVAGSIAEGAVKGAVKAIIPIP